jgi:hypothetical protein
MLAQQSLILSKALLLSKPLILSKAHVLCGRTRAAKMATNYGIFRNYSNPKYLAKYLQMCKRLGKDATGMDERHPCG